MLQNLILLDAWDGVKWAFGEKGTSGEIDPKGLPCPQSLDGRTGNCGCFHMPGLAWKEPRGLSVGSAEDGGVRALSTPPGALSPSLSDLILLENALNGLQGTCAQRARLAEGVSVGSGDFWILL